MKLQGKRIVVTGKVMALPRAAVYEQIRKLGGFPEEKVDAGTDIVVVKDYPQVYRQSVKHKAALTKQVPIINDRLFRDVLYGQLWLHEAIAQQKLIAPVGGAFSHDPVASGVAVSRALKGNEVIRRAAVGQSGPYGIGF